MVVKDDDDGFAGLEPVGELQQPRHRGAGGVAGEDAFLARDPARHQGGVLVRHLLEHDR